MENKAPTSDILTETAKAQLRKLSLEISALENEIEAKTGSAREDHEKLTLEITSLRRQNGLLSRVTQFATVLTVLATMTTILVSIFSLWSGYNKFITDKENDRQLKKQALLQETNKQYRAEIQQILQFPTGTKDTIPIAEFLLRDIHEVIETGYESDPQALDARRKEVGALLAQLVKSPEFNLSDPRNSEFDRKALIYTSYYSDHLISSPQDSLDIISQYKTALANLANDNQEYVSKMTVEGSLFRDVVNPRNDAVRTQFRSLFMGFRKHVELLAKSSEKNPDDIGIKQKLNLSFCWFYGTTENQQLTSTIFRTDPALLESRWNQLCQ